MRAVGRPWLAKRHSAIGNSCCRKQTRWRTDSITRILRAFCLSLPTPAAPRNGLLSWDVVIIQMAHGEYEKAKVVWHGQYALADPWCCDPQPQRPPGGQPLRCLSMTPAPPMAHHPASTRAISPPASHLLPGLYMRRAVEAPAANRGRTPAQRTWMARLCRALLSLRRSCRAVGRSLTGCWPGMGEGYWLCSRARAAPVVPLVTMQRLGHALPCRGDREGLFYSQP